TAVVTAAYSVLIATGSIDTIWPMFGIANQLLAVIALCLVTTLLINAGKARYAPVTLLPMLFVVSTTMTAAAQMIQQFLARMGTTLGRWPDNGGLRVFVLGLGGLVLLPPPRRGGGVMKGRAPKKGPPV